MKRLFLLAALAATVACAGPAKKTAELDLYLEQFDAVKTAGADIYLRASAIAEEKGGAKAEERRSAFESRLQALRIIDKYNRVLVGVARGEDPKHLKSGMKDVGSKLSAYRPSAQTTFAFAAAVPYLGTLLSGAGLVSEALAKRNFLKAVHAAQEPIAAILDILLLDSEPLETVLVQQVRKDQDPARAAVDSLGGRFYRKLKAVKPSPDLDAQVAAHNALREGAGFAPVPHAAAPSAAAPGAADLEYLAVLTDQAAFNLQAFKRADGRAAAEAALFARYRAALTAAKGALAALDKNSEPERIAATEDFNGKAFGVRQESVKHREAMR